MECNLWISFAKAIPRMPFPQRDQRQSRDMAECLGWGGVWNVDRLMSRFNTQPLLLRFCFGFGESSFGYGRSRHLPGGIFFALPWACTYNACVTTDGGARRRHPAPHSSRRSVSFGQFRSCLEMTLRALAAQFGREFRSHSGLFELTTIQGNRGRLRRRTWSPPLLSPHLDFSKETTHNNSNHLRRSHKLR